MDLSLVEKAHLLSHVSRMRENLRRMAASEMRGKVAKSDPPLSKKCSSDKHGSNLQRHASLSTTEGARPHPCWPLR